MRNEQNLPIDKIEQHLAEHVLFNIYIYMKKKAMLNYKRKHFY